jgi:hypothetical protein
MVAYEYIPCYSALGSSTPATRLASRKILIEQNIKSGQGQHSVYSVVVYTLVYPGNTAPSTHNKPCKRQNSPQSGSRDILLTRLFLTVNVPDEDMIL